MQRDQFRLADIIAAADQIAEYLAAPAIEEFLASNILHDAVIMQLIVLGEAAAKLSPELRARNDYIEWARIIGVRNHLAHDYFGTDLITIWQIATVHVPPLAKDVQQILASQFPTSDQPSVS